MPYHHLSKTHQKQKRSRRVLNFSLVFIGIIMVGAFSVVTDNFFNRSQGVEIESAGTQAKVQSSSINIFRTQYFQFQADTSWREVTDQLDPSTFVYRSYDQQLVQHQFVVQVDNIKPIALANENTTRVQPVTIDNNRLVPSGKVSDHCGTLVDDGSIKQARISYKEAEFPCNPDGQSFVSAVSVIGGNEFIDHISGGGDKIRFKLTYQDSTYSPSGRPLLGIINSFQLF
jgi:hypothetical protein